MDGGATYFVCFTRCHCNDQSKEDEVGDMRKTKILVGKRPLGRAKDRWEDNSKIYLKYIRWEHVDCIPLGQVSA